MTSGLPDDSREADDRVGARNLRDLRGRVKAARAMIATTPRLGEILAGDPRRAALFRARFAVTEEWMRKGVPPSPDADANPVEFAKWLCWAR